jgi:hypothetical protein
MLRICTALLGALEEYDHTIKINTAPSILCRRR